MTDTDKCPKCGWKAKFDGGGAACSNCEWYSMRYDNRYMSFEDGYHAALHRIRELEMSEQILRGGAEHLKRRVMELEAENERLSGGIDALEGLKDAYMDELTEAKSTVKELVVALADVLLQAASVGDKAGEIDDMGMAAYEEAGELLIRAGVADPMPRGCVIDGKRLEGFEPIFGRAREALKK